MTVRFVRRGNPRLHSEENTDWEICGEADDGQSAVEMVSRLKPDLVILDLSMPIMNGLSNAARHDFPDIAGIETRRSPCSTVTTC